MTRWTTTAAVKAISAVAFLGFASQAMAADVTWDRLLNAQNDDANWMMYHKDFTGHHHSGLKQINTRNVKNLKLAWQHNPAATKRGIQGFPLAVDGMVYYTTTSARFGHLTALPASQFGIMLQRLMLSALRVRSTTHITVV